VPRRRRFDADQARRIPSAGAGSRAARGAPADARLLARGSVSPICEHVFVRWDNLKTDSEESRALPGYREPAAVRTFDAPEALDVRFYEVQAKSILNRVPKASRMPFRWTINPYRGCTHACVYCLAGDTQVLMADGTGKPMAELRVGDAIYGTLFNGRRRFFVRTRVLAHWSTVKRAYRVVLNNGDELVASGDHRFLGDDGWRHVAAAGDRAGLAAGASLHGFDRGSRPVAGLEGRMVSSPRALEVASIEPLDAEMPLYDITTGTGDFIANGVVSHNCFARPTHTYLDFDAGRDFEREIVVKVNTPEVARAELMRASWTREHVALGTNTDPYQWVEKKYELLPGVWEAMRDSRTPSSVLTKSPLLLRDIDLFRQIPSFAANLSIPTLDEKAWRASEPHTPHPRKRIEAVAELNRAGIPTGVLVAPLMPGINDSPKQVEEILALCADAGATSIGGICLHLRGEVRDIVMDWLRSYRPDLVPRYEHLYARGAYAPKAERERLSRLVQAGRRVTGLRRDPAADDLPADAEPVMAAPPPEQPSLF
jgi:DNA repair photolyase